MNFNRIKSIVTISIIFLSSINLLANEPDSAYIFSYPNHSGRNGLEIAYSIDQQNWIPIGNDYTVVNSDYGSWGIEKKMYDPFLFLDQNNIWRCIWSLNDRDGVFAITQTKDLINWVPQNYPKVMQKGNVLKPEIIYLKDKEEYLISWLSLEKYQSNMQFFGCTTKDFKKFSEAYKVDASIRLNNKLKVLINGKEKEGVLNKVDWSTVQNLIEAQQNTAYKASLKKETHRDDERFFGNLKEVKATLTADFENSKEISDLLIGIFFEDINYAADGGLYAELIQNRGFEYHPHDKKERDPSWNPKKAWTFTGNQENFSIATEDPIHENNANYAILNIEKIGENLSNEGWDEIPINANESYKLSIWTRALNNAKIKVSLINQNNEEIASTVIKTKLDWKKTNTKLKANSSCKKARLVIEPLATGTFHIDMVSLFPENTFKQRDNGMRADLAQTIADLHPKFVRFPGGCVAHGDGIHNIYNWKNTIGPLETRTPQRNIWGYQQSYGLGYHEYFMFCEDLGAEPIPVVAAGVPCQNSSDCGAGQQGGIPMEDMDEYVQDVLDLVEYCNGDKTTEWGKKRIENGHAEPFNLKYLGIGNEDLIGDVFKERFEMIYKAVKETYPEIVVIGTVGPFYEGPDYNEGWKFNTELKVPMVDEHYYEQPGWFINNQNFYDRYDRNKPAVYLGEYASWGNELYNALAEAAYLTSIERNGDIVEMSSYAPLLAKHGQTQWRTDLIFFNNTEIFPTPNYQVQKLFGQNTGDLYVPSTIQLSINNEKARKRVASSILKDSETGDIIIKLVNILPVEVSTEINLEGTKTQQAQQFLLTGNPTDKKSEIVKSTIEISNSTEVKLPPYSLKVIRISNN